MDFSNIDINFILLIAGVAILGGLLIGLIVSFVIYTKIEQKYQDSLKESANSVRIYLIDIENNEVTFFNEAQLKNKHKISLSNFYNHFIASGREDLIHWVNALYEDPTSVPDYHEVKIISKHSNKHRYSSLLQYVKSDKKNIIHLDSYLLKDIASKHFLSTGEKKFSTQESFKKLLDSSTSNKGITAAFKFYNKRNSHEPISRIAFAQIKNIFASYILVNRPIIQYDDSTIILSDLRSAHKGQFMQIISAIRSEINSYLLISALQDQVDYTIGISENKRFPHEVDKLLSSVNSLSQGAREDNAKLMWYDEGKIFESGLTEENYHTEVERIISERKLKYGFRPIVNMERVNIFGYQSFVTPEDSFFGSISELKRYAVRTDDDRALFATIARNIISRFAQENSIESARLFFSINNFEKDYVNRTFAHISNIKDIHIVLVYSEQDLMELPKDSDDPLIAEIRTFKSKGYEVALELNDNDLTLSPMIYGLFDFFLADVNINLGNRTSQRTLLKFRSVVENLLKYHKPIIAVGVPTWDSVELLYKLGLTYISSEAISPLSENVLPLPAKSTIKVKTLINK